MPSFDGTLLAATAFWPASASASSRVPFVLVSPDWGAARESTVAGRPAELLAAGVGVLTYDSRGFGGSGGEAHYASPDFEVRDARALVTFLAQDAPVAFESAGDPVVGAEGRGHGAGVSLLLSATDPRVDAVVSRDGWSDLARGLAPGGVPKVARLREMALAGASREVLDWWLSAEATTRPSPEALAAWADRSPLAVGPPRAPTMLQQRFDDARYDAKQAVHLHALLATRGVPAKLWLDDASQEAKARAAATAWLRCHLRAECAGVTAGVEWLGGDGVWRAASSWPPPQRWRSVMFDVGPFTGAGVPLVALKTVSARPECVGACDLAVDTASGAGGIILRQCTGGGSCGGIAGAARLSLTWSVAGADGAVFVGLATRAPDGTIAPLHGQLVPVRQTPSSLGTTSVAVDLPDVGALPQAPDQVVFHVQTAHADFASPRLPYGAGLSGTLTWPSDV